MNTIFCKKIKITIFSYFYDAWLLWVKSFQPNVDDILHYSFNMFESYKVCALCHIKYNSCTCNFLKHMFRLLSLFYISLLFILFYIYIILLFILVCIIICYQHNILLERWFNQFRYYIIRICLFTIFRLIEFMKLLLYSFSKLLVYFSHLNLFYLLHQISV